MNKLKKLGFLLVFLLMIIIGWSLGALLTIMPFIDLNKPIPIAEGARQEKYNPPCPTIFKIKSLDAEWNNTETSKFSDLNTIFINAECNNYKNTESNNYAFFP